MKSVWWMVGASLASWLAATAALGTDAAFEIFLGMIGPLVVASGTWIVIERTHRTRPDRITSLMIAMFGAKMLLFGVYVAVVLRSSVRPLPFVVSFTGYFIALHMTEAFYLRRLFAKS